MQEGYWFIYNPNNIAVGCTSVCVLNPCTGNLWVLMSLAQNGICIKCVHTSSRDHFYCVTQCQYCIVRERQGQKACLYIFFTDAKIVIQSCWNKRKGVELTAMEMNVELTTNKFIVKSYVYVCVFMCSCTCPWSPERVLDCLELELQGCCKPPDVGGRNLRRSSPCS